MRFVEYVFFIFLNAVSIFYTASLMHRNLQWLQQSSYRNIRFFRRLFDKRSGTNYTAVIISLLILTIGFIAYFYFSKDKGSFNIFWILLVISSLPVFILFIKDLLIINKKSENKKPFVYTKRSTRLYIVTNILYTSISILNTFAVLHYYSRTLLYMTPISLFLASWVCPLLSNWLLLPIETLVNRSFINDAKRIRNSMTNLKVVGITGSYGKTSTKNIINKILSQKYMSLQTPSSYNTELGITRTIRESLKPIHDVFIAEMGAREVGDIKKCCDIAVPNYSVLTIVGKQHLETFKTFDNIRNTKAEIVRFLDSKGKAFMNADDPSTELILPSVKADTVLFGIDSDKASVRASDIKLDSTGCSFIVNIDDKLLPEGVSTVHRFTTQLLGRPNIYNILCGIAVGIIFDVPVEYIKYAVSVLEPIEHRLKIIKRSGDITVIDDSFNSNPNGFLEAINVLSSFGKEHRKIIITPGMVELGKEEYKHNKNAGKRAGEKCDYIILVGERRTKPLQDGIAETDFDKNNLYIAETLNEAKKHFNSISKSGDVVLFENDLPDVY